MVAAAYGTNRGARVIDAHDGYIVAGGCPSTMPDNAKCWCNGQANHLGDHWAVRLHPSERRTIIYWTGHP